MNSAIITIYILLFISIIFLVHGIISFSKERKIVTTSAKKVINKFSKNEEKRKKKKEKLELEQGYQEKYAYLDNFDLLLERSGVRTKIPFINSEIYISGSILISALSIVFSKNLFIGIILSLIIIAFSYIFLYLRAGHNYEKIEVQIMPFLNLLENYAKTNDDIVAIFQKTIPYLKYPLRNYIEQFVIEVNTYGNMYKSFSDLEYKIENMKLKSLIRNLSMASRFEANYQEVIRDERDTFKSYLKAKQKRKSIINNGRIEILMCLGFSVAMLSVFSKFSSGIWYALFNTLIGNLIILYCVVVLIICAWNMVDIDRKE